MNSTGYRGRNHGGRYRCAQGYRGESQLGVPGTGQSPYGMGGGGGGAGQDDASGGGGGHGATGSNGANGGCGACRQACPIPGGRGGSVASDNLRSTIFFGGSGGEGGADEDGCHPGRGGNGGGIIIAHASSVQIEGTVRANGQGGSGGNSGGCGSGCGMGGGGGGAGGAVRIASASDATLGTNRITVSGGGGGRATCGARRLGRSGTHRCARTERVRVLEPSLWASRRLSGADQLDQVALLDPARDRQPQPARLVFERHNGHGSQRVDQDLLGRRPGWRRRRPRCVQHPKRQATDQLLSDAISEARARPTIASA